jgi:aryl-alcohol dehydrogenase-like predicted oxidoreductase
VEYAALGDTGQLVSRVGYGCAAIDGYDYGTVDDRDSQDAIHCALELGITCFDTADVYGLGHAERVLSQALGSRRHDVLISTKFGIAWDERGRTWRDTSPARVSAALHESLRRLRLERIPLYQLHWPDGTTPIGDTLAALLRHQEEGKIGAIGLCNEPRHVLEEALTSCRIQSLQVPFSLLEREVEEEIEQCRSRFGIGVLTYNSLAQGLLTGKYGRASTFSGTDLRRRSQLFTPDVRERGLQLVERLQIVGRRYGRTSAQVALRWILEHRSVTVALTGAKTVSQITENVGGSDWSLAPDDVALLEAPLSAVVDSSNMCTP